MHILIKFTCKNFRGLKPSGAHQTMPLNTPMVLSMMPMCLGRDDRSYRVQRREVGGLRGVSEARHQEGRQIPEQGSQGQLLLLMTVTVILFFYPPPQ